MKKEALNGDVTSTTTDLHGTNCLDDEKERKVRENSHSIKIVLAVVCTECEGICARLGDGRLRLLRCFLLRRGWMRSWPFKSPEVNGLALRGRHQMRPESSWYCGISTDSCGHRNFLQYAVLIKRLPAGLYRGKVFH